MIERISLFWVCSLTLALLSQGAAAQGAAAQGEIKATDLAHGVYMLTGSRAAVAAEMAKGSDLAAVQAAKPCAPWDEELGHVWLTSDQFVQPIFDSLNQDH